MKPGRIFATLLLVCLSVCVNGAEEPAKKPETPPRWTPDQAQQWFVEHGWLVGCNFSPSSAINQLEMWQADTFDPATIDRELGWAQDLGFNSVRVFLHDIPWKADKEGTAKRMDQFLGLCEKHSIGVMFVLLDACWDPLPKAGKQPAPKPFLHNSGWVQCPSQEILKDPALHDELEGYVKGVIERFREDKRIHAWDLYNEPGNKNDSSYGKAELKNKNELMLALLKKSFDWARAANPTQPLTSGVWVGEWADEAKLSPIEKVQIEQSDIVTFHNYGKPDAMKRCITNLRRYGRPLLCTEYMARPAGSTFDPILGNLKQQQVGAYNWGFVSGKTQTIYPWDSWKTRYTAEPPVWFHDIFRPDGKPYDQKEVDYIKWTTGGK